MNWLVRRIGLGPAVCMLSLAVAWLILTAMLVFG